MKRSDIPFSSDSSKFFIPWLSMIMVFIATLVFCIALLIYTSLSDWKKDISGSLTVQIPTYDMNGQSRAESLKNDIEMTLTLLRSSDGIIGAEVLTGDKMEDLMSPWFGNTVDIKELPLPLIIDVKTDPLHFPDLTQIKADLSEQVPSAILDSHRAALNDMITFFDNIIRLIAVILLLLFITGAISIIFVTRSSLAIHQKVIELIHMMGASDFYITIQFATRSFKLAFFGSILGFLFALPIIFIFQHYINAMSAGFILYNSLSVQQWSMLGAIPLTAAVLSFVTAFYTANHHLKNTL